VVASTPGRFLSLARGPRVVFDEVHGVHGVGLMFSLFTGGTCSVGELVLVDW
jgi:hypothetical protein